MNLCTKPSCARPGAVVLSYDYAAKRAILDDPGDGQLSPHVYVLCSGCAERLRPPNGWQLDDLRSEPPLFLDRMEGVVAATPGPAEAPAEVGGGGSKRQVFFGYSG